MVNETSSTSPAFVLGLSAGERVTLMTSQSGKTEA